MTDRPRSDPYLETATLTATAVSLLGVSGISPALPEIQQSFAGAPDAAYLTKSVISAVGVAMVIASPLTALAFRTFGRRPTLISAYAIFLVAGVGGLWLPTLPLIVASRFLVGAASAIIVTSGLTLIADFHDGHPREWRIGANHGVGTFATGALLPVAGMIANHDWRLSGLIYLAALPGFLAVILSPALNWSPPAATRAGRTALPMLSRASKLFVLVALACGTIAFSIQLFLPFRVAELGEADAAFAGQLLALSMVCSVTTSFLYARIRLRLSPAMLFAITFTGWIAAFGLLALASDRAQMLLAMVFIGVPGGLLGPNLFSVVSALANDDNRASAVGLTKGIYYFGPFAGATLLHPVSEHFGASGAFLALCASAAAMTLASLVIGLRSQARPPALQAEADSA